MDKGSGILCLGALNEDEVHVGTVPRHLIDLLAENGVRYAPYAEIVLSDELADRIRSHLGVPSHAHLGGAAFNVARILPTLAPEIRIGFAGVAGKTATGAHPHAAYLEDLGVETGFLSLSEHVPARSIGFTADGDRTLLTSVGSSSEVPDYLTSNESELPDYMASFEVIHITSILDPSVPELLAQAVERAFASNNELIVSVDPGHYWAVDVAPSAERLIACSNILHLKAREFSALGGMLRIEQETVVADRVLRLMRSGPRYLLVRRHDSASVFFQDERSEIYVSTVPYDMVPTDEILDASGSSDAFTAGMLALLGSSFLRAIAGARLGSALAAEKVRQLGPLSTSSVVEAAERVVGKLGEIVTERRSPEQEA